MGILGGSAFFRKGAQSNMNAVTLLIEELGCLLIKAYC